MHTFLREHSSIISCMESFIASGSVHSYDKYEHVCKKMDVLIILRVSPIAMQLKSNLSCNSEPCSVIVDNYRSNICKNIIMKLESKNQ